MDGYHKSVLLNEVIEALQVAKDKWYLDATLGDGGHALEILKLGGKVIGVDADPQAILRAEDRLKKAGFGEKDFKFIQGNFRDLNNLINSQAEPIRQQFGVKSYLAGCVFDLGVSSLQLENPERGFSFAKGGPLDMRMDPSLGVKAWDLVNNLSGKELYELFNTLGEEKYSWKLAGALVRAREVKPLTTTKDLADVVAREFGGIRGRIHPATRIFQALRIAVNDELGALQEGLGQIKGLMEKNGHIVAISFHSLEDRIVKNTFRDWEEKELGEVVTKKPVVPTDEEIGINPKSRSAKLRVFKIT